jgi:hypothetical protein
MAVDALIVQPHESDKLCASVQGFKNGDDHGNPDKSDSTPIALRSNNRRNSAMAKLTIKCLSVFCAILSVLCLCLIGVLIYFIVMMGEGGDPGHHGQPPPTSSPPPIPSSSSTIAPRTSTTGATDQSQVCYDVNNSPGYQEAAKNILGSIDFSADPCQDFYQFACGVWPLKNPRPGDRSKWSIYSTVSQQVSDKIKLAVANIDASTSSEGLKKVKATYDSCMNESRIEEVKGQPLAQLLHNGIVETPYLTGFVNGEGRWPLIDEAWTQSGWQPEAIIGTIHILKFSFLLPSP